MICKTKLLMKECKVFYREKGSSKWLPAFGSQLDSSFGEKFRTSIVDLKPDTLYEVKAELSRGRNKEQASGSFRTWAEKVPVGKTVFLTAEQAAKGIVIKDKGTPEKWIRYTAAPGVILDGKRNPAAIVLQEAEYVILENLTVRGGSASSVTINHCKNVRLINCDLGSWGDPENWRYDPASGRTRFKTGQLLWNKNGIQINWGSGIVIERCYIHDPLLSANSWNYAHPEGSQGISAFKPRSTVIRYNDICASDLKWWNDGIAGNRNFDLDGGLNRDCDVYGNFIAFANDDAIELDGGQQNVRCFRNHFENCFMGISIQGCMTGPSFIYENRIVDLGDEFMVTASAIKTADIWGGHYAGAFFYNNTTDQTAAKLQLCRNFRIVAVNNILEEIVPPLSVFGFLRTAWHHNLLKIDSGRGNFRGSALFTDPSRGIFTLQKNSPARNRGVPIPGLNGRRSRDLGAPQDLELPFRPFPLSLTNGRKVLFKVENKKCAPRTITVKASAPVKFSVHKSADSDWYDVVPAAASLKKGESLTITVKVKPEKMNSRINYRSVFFLRTPEGWSRPVSVKAVSDFKYPPVADSGVSRVFKPGAPFTRLPGGGVRFDGKEKQISFNFEIPKKATAFLCADVRLGKGVKRGTLYAGMDTKPSFCSVRGAGSGSWEFVSLRTHKLAPGKHTLNLSPRESLDVKAFYLFFDNAALKERR